MLDEFLGWSEGVQFVCIAVPIIFAIAILHILRR